MSGHLPVLVEEVLRGLDPQPGHFILDGTVGLGGHATCILPKLVPGGRYLGLDLDPNMLEIAREKLESVAPGAPWELVHRSYAAFADVLAEQQIEHVDGMLLDLGINSAQLDDPARGFAMDHDGPLDMRFDPSQQKSALDLVNRLEETELANLIFEYGQDGHSRRIAREICRARRERRIATTRELASIVAASREGGGGRTNPATRVFQALRIAVNGELDNLQSLLDQAPGHIRTGGRLAVISFHSLEDAIVKRAFREGKKNGVWRELTKRPVGPTQQEQRQNPRARSAKLRVAERLPEN